MPGTERSRFAGPASFARASSIENTLPRPGADLTDTACPSRLPRLFTIGSPSPNPWALLPERRIEKEQDLRTQEFTIRSDQALIEQSQQKIAQITADYRRQLQTERIDVAAQLERATQELAKLSHRHELLDLRAPQAGIVKDLATHTTGTVAAPGTILMTLVPEHDKLVAEVWVSNQDVGFVRAGQEAKLKLAAFQFQKYGLMQGKVLHVNADATEAPSPNTRSDALTGRDRPMGPLAFRALVDLGNQELVADGERYALQPGMQVAGEIHLGTRTILEYLLSPVQKAFHEAARER